LRSTDHTKKIRTDTNKHLSRFLSILLAALLFFVLTGMKLRPGKDALFSVSSSISNDASTCDSLIAFAKQYLKKPYCYGSRVPRCFDCSGFVQFVFSNFGKSLPNSSGIIALQGKFISFKNAVAGDLVFFNGSNANNATVGHVGIVTARSGDTISFIRASGQAGVIVSNTKESYYSKRLLFVKRVQLPQMDRKQ